MTKRSKPTGEQEFRSPGVLETLRDGLLGRRRLLDCVQVEVTSRCPGRCMYCPRTIFAEKWRSRDMAMEVFQRLWPVMGASARVHLQGWGEPFLNSNFFDMAELARRAGCSVSTTTCGLIMDETLALKIVDSGIDIIAFSMTGTEAAGHNAFRQGVDFQRVCDAVSLLQDVRKSRQGVHLEIHFAYLMMASQVEAVRALPSLMRHLGVHAAVVSTLDYVPRTDLASEAITVENDELLSKATAVLAETSVEAAALGLDFHYALPRKSASGTVCHENIQRTMCVSVEGFVSPCVLVNVPAEGLESRRRVFGNVENQNPLDIWNSASFRRFRERLAQGDPDLVCQTCPKRFMD